MRTTHDGDAGRGDRTARSRDPWRDRLSDYLDGELSGTERRDLDRHLIGCVECRAVLEGFREVVARARLLDPGSQPGHDLWPGIQARLAPKPRGSARVARHPIGWNWRAWRAGLGGRVYGWLPLRLTVATALVVALIGGAISLVPALRGTLPWAGTSARPPAPVSALAAEREYEDTVAGLRRAVHETLTGDPQVVRVLERNLSLLDMAIAEYREALGQQPDDIRLRAWLAMARDRKVQLLRHAAVLAAERTN